MTYIYQIIPLFILVPLVGVFFLALLARKKNINADIIFFFNIVGLLFLSFCLFGIKSNSMIYVYCLNGWHLPEAINLIIDGMAAFFLITICLISFCIMLFSLRFMEHYTAKWKFYALFLLLLTGVNGVIIAGDLFTMYLFMEVAAISSYALVCFSLEDNALAFGFKYMVKGVMASAIIFLGIAICYCFTSTLALADISNQLFLRQNVDADPAMGFVILFIQTLLFLGFLIKSGIVPFNSWVTDINKHSLAPVAAIMGAIIIPALGIYPFLRIYFNVISPSDQSMGFVRIIALISMLGSMLWAFKAKCNRQIIAYHTISEFAFAILAMAIATPWAIFGGFLQLINASLTAALLNCNEGLADYMIYPKKNRLFGLCGFKTMPGVFMSNFFSNLALISMPPFLGFWSKLIIIVAAWKAGYKVYAMAMIIVICFGVLVFIKKQVSSNANLQKNKYKLNKIKPSMAMSLLLMIGLCLGLNVLLLSEYENTFIRPAMQTILSTTKYSKAVFKAEYEK